MVAGAAWSGGRRSLPWRCRKHRGVAAQVEFESKIEAKLEAIYHINFQALSSRRLQHGVHRVNLHCPTEVLGHGGVEHVMERGRHGVHPKRGVGPLGAVRAGRVKLVEPPAASGLLLPAAEEQRDAADV